MDRLRFPDIFPINTFSPCSSLHCFFKKRQQFQYDTCNKKTLIQFTTVWLNLCCIKFACKKIVFKRGAIVTVHLCLTTLHLPASISQSDTPLSSNQLHSPVLSALLWLYLSPSSTLTHCQIVLDACTRLSSVSMPDRLVSTLLASDYPALRISWK